MKKNPKNTKLNIEEFKKLFFEKIGCRLSKYRHLSYFAKREKKDEFISFRKYFMKLLTEYVGESQKEFIEIKVLLLRSDMSPTQMAEFFINKVNRNNDPASFYIIKTKDV